MEFKPVAEITDKEKEWEKQAIKHAILRSAENLRQSSVCIANDLIEAFTKVNQHYRQDQTGND